MHGKNPPTKNFAIRPFDKLKKKLASRETLPASLPPVQKKKNEYTDDELFSTAMNMVKEIKEFRELPFAQGQKKKVPIQERGDPDQEALLVLCGIADGRQAICLSDTQEYVEWTNPDYQGGLAEQMHKGRFSIQAYLDLHGFTVAEAESKMADFLKESLSRGLRCVKIIHGRGLRSVNGPRIKTSVLRRLSGHFRKDIISYVSARQCDGGLGALYILLRKK